MEVRTAGYFERVIGKRKTRSDALPEYAHYGDTGCDLASSCLVCPFSACRYDTPGGLQRLRNQERNQHIVSLCAAGVSRAELAVLAGLSILTVRHIIRVAERVGG